MVEVRSTPAPFIWRPTFEESIIQNVRMIITTYQGTCPMHRIFGFDSAIIDLPPPVAQAMVRSWAWDAIERWEPRFETQSIDFEYDEQGTMITMVRGNIIV